MPCAKTRYSLLACVSDLHYPQFAYQICTVPRQNQLHISDKQFRFFAVHSALMFKILALSVATPLREVWEICRGSSRKWISDAAARDVAQALRRARAPAVTLFPGELWEYFAGSRRFCFGHAYCTLSTNYAVFVTLDHFVSSISASSMIQ